MHMFFEFLAWLVGHRDYRSTHRLHNTHLFLNASKVGGTQSAGVQEGCRQALQGQQCFVLVHFLPYMADQKAMKPRFYSLKTQSG